MTMDFFQHQENAQRNTKVLVALFVAAVVGIVLAVHVVVALTWQYAAASEGLRTAGSPLTDPVLLGSVALGVGLLVGTGSLYKISALGSGGAGIAGRLGGRLLDQGTSDPDERRLLNVVEEMAIASGIPVPPVYVMDDEEGINAFAAGTETGNAVIGVTRGCITWLTRDELQGVVAHEFSHILNGDMRLNLRLIGILHGILLLGLIGRIVVRGGGRGGRRSRDGGGWIVLLGLALLIIGYVGTFMGNLIKAAVSREREFLADASAVQFTRNPDGIGGALRKIGGLPAGSMLDTPRAAEASHMYFGEGVKTAFSGLLATHPPLAERVRRIDPSFDGEFAVPEAPPSAELGDEAEVVAGLAGAGGAVPAGASVVGAGAGAARVGVPGGGASSGGPGLEGLEAAIGRIGQPGQEHVAHARRVLEELPDVLRAAAREKVGARALVYALLLDEDPSARTEQRRRIDASGAPAVGTRLDDLEADVGTLAPEARLPLVEVAAATLRELSTEEYHAFRSTVDDLTSADGRTQLFEWVVARFLVHHLEPHFEEERRRRGSGFDNLRALSADLACLLSFLAWAGHDEPGAARAAFDQAVDSLGDWGALDPWSEERCTLPALEAALDRLARLAPRSKRDVLVACARSIAADQRVTVEEGELFRVVADWLECPVPPLLPGAGIAADARPGPPETASRPEGSAAS